MFCCCAKWHKLWSVPLFFHQKCHSWKRPIKSNICKTYWEATVASEACNTKWMEILTESPEHILLNLQAQTYFETQKKQQTLYCLVCGTRDDPSAVDVVRVGKRIIWRSQVSRCIRQKSLAAYWFWQWKGWKNCCMIKDVRNGGCLGWTTPLVWYVTKALLSAQRILLVFDYILLVTLSTQCNYHEINLHTNFNEHCKMDQKVIIRFFWKSWLSTASRNNPTAFCRPFVHYACLRLCSAIFHFIRNNCLYFVCYGWSAHALTAVTTLPISVAW